MALFTRKSKKNSALPNAVIFYAYPKLLFAWPLILLGYVLWIFGSPTSTHLEGLAWIWGIVLILTLITLGIDIGRNAMAFWLVSVVAIWILGLYLRDVQRITIFGDIYQYFANLDVQYDRNLGLVVSIWLTVPYLVMFLWSRLNDKWRFTHNEFEHRAFGKVDWSAARAAKTVRTSYPDLLEAMFCLAGDLIIYDPRGAKIIRQIPHVPLLPLVRRRINLILEYTAVTTAQIEDEEAADEASDDDR